MIKILAVNNYPTRERFQRLEACLKDNGADVVSIDWADASASEFSSFDGIALSGSPDMMSQLSTQAKFSKEIAAIQDSDVPILGVCFGHQMMAHAFGAKVIKDRRKVLGMVKTRVLENDPLFRRLPRSLMLLESRREVVESLPSGFHLIAVSDASRIATMKHRNRPLYGVQFHPERYTKAHPEGSAVVGNFIHLLE